MLIVCTTGVGAEDASAPVGERLPDTAPLDWQGDLARRMVEGIDRFLLAELEASIERRAAFWDRSSPDRLAESLAANRQRLAHILGVRDERLPFDALELVATTSQPALVGTGAGYKIYAVRWPVIRNIHGEGLWLVPENSEHAPAVIALPDADQTPEMIAGLAADVARESQFARRLAENGCRV